MKWSSHSRIEKQYLPLRDILMILLCQPIVPSYIKSRTTVLKAIKRKVVLYPNFCRRQNEKEIKRCKKLFLPFLIERQVIWKKQIKELCIMWGERELNWICHRIHRAKLKLKSYVCKPPENYRLGWEFNEHEVLRSCFHRSLHLGRTCIVTLHYYNILFTFSFTYSFRP